MKVLGINYGHSAAAAILVDGKIIAAIEEEKLSRIKGDIAFPHRAIKYVLNRTQCTIQDVDFVAVGCEHLEEFVYSYRRLNSYFGNNSFADKASGYFFDGLKRLFPYKFDIVKRIHQLFYKNLNRLGIPFHKIRLVNHHEAHAASAYYTSPWDDCYVFTNDGKGDGLCGSFYDIIDGKLECIDRIIDLNSVGQFYQAVTKFLGYRINRHEGKITGLAAFGCVDKSFAKLNSVYSFEGGCLYNQIHEDEELAKNPLQFYYNNVHNRSFIHPNYLKGLTPHLMRFAISYQMYLDFLKQECGQMEPKDIAAGIQELTEQVLVAYVADQIKDKQAKPICLAGGVFANVKVNQKIGELDKIKGVFVHPAMDDAGTSLGAALITSIEEAGVGERESLQTVYLGPCYDDSEIEKTLKKFGLKYRRSDNFAAEIGKMIYEGKIIGRFDGGLEWGPRALGNRSIIARPIDKTINDTLNARLSRTEFMPFAPSMLDEDAQNFLVDYTDEDIAAKYMTITYHVYPEKIDTIQAAVHIDGTARPQVVRKKDNESYYQIIQEYKKHSGFGVVINTSFNMHEEPIVSSPDDAIRAFQFGAVDVLSIGSFIVESEV